MVAYLVVVKAGSTAASRVEMRVDLMVVAKAVGMVGCWVDTIETTSAAKLAAVLVALMAAHLVG